MKIFGIGLSRTGTHTLTDALEILGYSAKHWVYTRTLLDYSSGTAQVRFDRVDPYDAFTDTPIALTYKELDQRYPGSKFILTTRNLDSWLKSCSHKFAEPRTRRDIGNQLNFDLYGATVYDEDKFRAGYLRHHEEVRDYFSERPEDLLVIDVIAGEGWEKLCQFLDRSIPEETFPKKAVRGRNASERKSHETIYFYVPERERYEEFPARLSDCWDWCNEHAVPSGGRLGWSMQTVLYLREAGVSCNITPRLPEQGIIISHVDYLREAQRTSSRQFFVCVKAERDDALPYCNMYVAESMNEPAPRPIWKRLIQTHCVPRWPQLSLIPRDVSRGDAFENARHYGCVEDLNPSLVDLPAELPGLSMRWEVVAQRRWHDYRETDVAVAVQREGRAVPNSMLVNAWLAGTPAIVSPEPAYRELKRSALDYIEVASRSEVMDALARLAAEPNLRREMSENGRARSDALSPAALTRGWVELLENVVKPMHAEWAASPLKRVVGSRMIRRASTAFIQASRC